MSERRSCLRIPDQAAALALSLGLALAHGAAAAQPARMPASKPAPASEKALAQGPALYWYDGGQRRALAIDPEWVADFDPAARGAGRSPMRKATAVEKEKGPDPAAAFASPVFRDPSSPGAAPRALPGGVIVIVREADAARARELLASKGLKPLRPVGAAGTAWVVEAAPGMPSLELANRLQEGGDFAGASPNWWRPRALK